MSKEDQDAIMVKKLIERRDSRIRLQCLVERATRYAQECQQIAYELNKAAGNPTGDRIPGLTLQARTFITKDEFDTLIRELDAERSNLSKIETALKLFGLD